MIPICCYFLIFHHGVDLLFAFVLVISGPWFIIVFIFWGSSLYVMILTLNTLFYPARVFYSICLKCYFHIWVSSLYVMILILCKEFSTVRVECCSFNCKIDSWLFSKHSLYVFSIVWCNKWNSCITWTFRGVHAMCDITTLWEM